MRKRTKEELQKKCSEIIDSLKGYTLEEKGSIISSLYHSFKDTLNNEGMGFVEIDENTGKVL